MRRRPHGHEVHSPSDDAPRRAGRAEPLRLEEDQRVHVCAVLDVLGSVCRERVNDDFFSRVVLVGVR